MTYDTQVEELYAWKVFTFWKIISLKEVQKQYFEGNV